MSKGGAFPQPPEGLLIEQVRKDKGLTQNECAERLGISGNRWRYIVRGHNPDGRPVNAQVTTWVRLAMAVGAEPEDFELLIPPRRDIASMIRAYTSRPDNATVDAYREHDLLVRLLTAIRDAFGREAFNAAVRLLARGKSERGDHEVDT